MSGGAAPAERHVQVVGLHPDRREEYERLHESVWPGVEEAMRAAHLRDYSIHRLGDLLIACFEYTGHDFSADMARLAEDPVTQQWWEIVGPCQVAVCEGGGPSLWREAAQVWRLP